MYFCFQFISSFNEKLKIQLFYNFKIFNLNNFMKIHQDILTFLICLKLIFYVILTVFTNRNKTCQKTVENYKRH